MEKLSIDMVQIVCDHLKSSKNFINTATDVLGDSAITMLYTVISEDNTEKRCAPRWTAMIMPEKRQMIIESPTSARQFQRDAITTILDVAETLGLTHVYSTVPKESSEAKELVRTWMYLGFSLVAPAVKNIDGIVLLGYEL